MSSYTTKQWETTLNEITWLYNEGANLAEISSRLDLSETVILEIIRKYIDERFN